MDKRNPDRFKRRIAVQFGVSEPNRTGFTEDISEGGLFLRVANVCVPNTVLNLKIDLDKETTVTMTARVMWAKKVPQNVFHLVKKSGMGLRIIRFYSGEQQYRQFCQQYDKHVK